MLQSTLAAAPHAGHTRQTQSLNAKSKLLLHLEMRLLQESCFLVIGSAAKVPPNSLLSQIGCGYTHLAHLRILIRNLEWLRQCISDHKLGCVRRVSNGWRQAQHHELGRLIDGHL